MRSNRTSVTIGIIAIIIGLVILAFAWAKYKEAPVTNTTSNVSQQATTNKDETAPVADTEEKPLIVYYIATGDNGESGVKVGCGDSLVMTKTEPIKSKNRLKEAFERLLSNHDQFYGQSGLYNALYQSRLTYKNGTVTDTTVNVQLEGRLMQGGECDSPRIQAQLEELAKAATGAVKVNITINGASLTEVLSSK